MIFLYLIIGHLIGDFPLQTNFIYRLKLKAWWGIIPHILLVSFSIAFICFPFWDSKNIWVLIGLNALIHYFQDYFKIKLNEVLSSKELFYFCLDQVIHILILVFLGFSLLDGDDLVVQNGIVFKLYNNLYFLIYLISLISATYIYEISKYIQLKKRNGKHFRYNRDWMGIIKRGIGVSVIFGAIYAISGLAG